MLYLFLVAIGLILLIVSWWRSIDCQVKRRKEMQKLADELAAANRQLKELDEAKSLFVSIVSHQLRTPIAGVKGYLSMLADGDFGKLTAKQEEVIRMNLENIERLVRLIEVFLDISRIEAGRLQLNREQIALDKLVYGVVSELLPSAQHKGLILSAELPKKLPLLSADGTRLHSILLNLIDNAIKYTDKGSVTIHVRVLPKEIIFEVADTGRGVKKGEEAALFRKFVRGEAAEENPNGAGLGLFIVKELVEAHGGRLWVESRGPRQGSVFSFSIPILLRTEHRT